MRNLMIVTLVASGLALSACSQATQDQAKATADQAAADAKAATDQAAADAKAAADKAAAAAEKERQKEYDRLMKASGGSSRTTRKKETSPLEQVLNSKSTQTILNSVIRGIFGTGRR